MKIGLPLLTLVFCSFIYSQEKVMDHPDREDLRGLKSGDAEMEAAFNKARSTLKTFIEHLEKRDNKYRYLLKVRFEEDGEIEHMWLEPVKLQSRGVIGILASDPASIKKIKKGDVITPTPKEISDWLILKPDGTKEGGFSIDILDKRSKKK